MNTYELVLHDITQPRNDKTVTVQADRFVRVSSNSGLINFYVGDEIVYQVQSYRVIELLNVTLAEEVKNAEYNRGRQDALNALRALADEMIEKVENERDSTS